VARQFVEAIKINDPIDLLQTTMNFKDGKFGAIQRCEEGPDVKMEIILDENGLHINLNSGEKGMSQHFQRIA